jgi:hypothetical protein
MKKIKIVDNEGKETTIKSIEDSPETKNDFLSKKSIKKPNKFYKKYESNQCNNKMTFEECELAILRHAVDENEKIVGEKIANTDDIKRIISILETFLTKSKCICYGGSAINALLPINAQFYNKNVEIPDYDFYTPNAINVARELANIYYKEGYEEVEAKSGVHFGTYKVFVNFIPIADITYINPHIYERLSNDSISVAGIKYAPVNFLRMSMYLELSRPMGDTSRWEKVFKRLSLLNKYHPIKLLKVCKTVDFHTNLRDINIPSPMPGSINLDFIETSSGNNKKIGNEEKSEIIIRKNNETLYYRVRDSLIEQGAVFIGGYAASLYKKYLPKHLKRNPQLLSVPDFDVIIEDSAKCSLILRERLQELGFKNITETFVPQVDDLIPSCYEIRVNKKLIANIFSTVACHNYNKINVGTNIVNVATIDTIMSFYLAFYFSERFIYFRERILCMAKFLFDLEKHNHLNQHGLLKRFSMTCVGKQKTIEIIRSEKTEKYNELKMNKNSKEYDKWFFNYRPGDENEVYLKPPLKNKSILTKIRNDNLVSDESINTNNTNGIKSILKPSSLLSDNNSLDQSGDIKLLYDKLDNLPKPKNKTKKIRFEKSIGTNTHSSKIQNVKNNFSKKKYYKKKHIKTQKKYRIVPELNPEKFIFDFGKKSTKEGKNPPKKYVSKWMNRRGKA